jgi:organic radical activating enzyme
MANITEQIKNWLKPARTPRPGIYHYISPASDPRNYRLHLRVEPDGNGLLLINAATVLHLNQTATEYAYYLVENLPADEAGQLMAQHYHVPAEAASQDYLNFSERIQTVINSPDLDPVTFLDFDRHSPFSRRITAPYRLDCALTYRLPEGARPEFAPAERVKRELSTDEWKSILDKAWNAGIPHILFTGGEPTLRDDLAELVAHAEKNNQISGLVTDGMRFSEEAYRETLLQTGLDHVMVLLDPDNAKSWEAVHEALVEDLSVAVHLTLSAENQAEYSEMLKRLAGMGVKKVSLSTSDPGLEKALDDARNQAAFAGLELIWDLPVPYSANNPVSLEIANRNKKKPAGRAWMYVEPDGDVLPEQGELRVLGNLLNDPWEAIWKSS